MDDDSRIKSSFFQPLFRRFGAVDGGRFCFEGGSRCGRGEGVFVLRVDDPSTVNADFESAARGRMEARRKQGAFKSGCE